MSPEMQHKIRGLIRTTSFFLRYHLILILLPYNGSFIITGPMVSDVFLLLKKDSFTRFQYIVKCLVLIKYIISKYSSVLIICFYEIQVQSGF